jgi:hypothetical protein
VAEPTQPLTLTPEEHRVMTLLRQGPPSLRTWARTMDINDHHIDAIVRSLDGHVGLVRVCRSGTLGYGLAESPRPLAVAPRRGMPLSRTLLC